MANHPGGCQCDPCRLRESVEAEWRDTVCKAREARDRAEAERDAALAQVADLKKWLAAWRDDIPATAIMNAQEILFRPAPPARTTKETP